MKLHLPIKLYRAVLACFVAAFSLATASLAYAATPDDEEEQLMLLSDEYPKGSVIYTTQQTKPLILTGYESILFKDISTTSDGGANIDLAA